MKKLNTSIVLLFSLILLTSCFWPNQDVEDAKKELGITQEAIDKSKEELLKETDKKTEETTSETDNTNTDIDSSLNPVEEKIELVTITPLTDEQFITVNEISEYDINNKHIVISWTVKEGLTVDKVRVDFSNTDSTFPTDSYVLNQYKPEENKFKYNALRSYEVLDYGENIYVIYAFSWEKVSKTEVKIILQTEEERLKTKQSTSKDNTPVEMSLGESEISTLETGTEFWTPRKTGENTFVYSDVKGLEITKKEINSPTCDAIDDYIKENINSWYYWNTCRPIADNDGVSYYMIRLDGDNYVYEKHYLSFTQNYHWILELETGSGVDSSNIAQKNKELKEKNDEYTVTEVADKLFISLSN